MEQQGNKELNTLDKINKLIYVLIRIALDLSKTLIILYIMIHTAQRQNERGICLTI